MCPELPGYGTPMAQPCVQRLMLEAKTSVPRVETAQGTYTSSQNGVARIRYDQIAILNW